MRLSKRCVVLILLICAVFSLSGCATLARAPGALLGGVFKLIGSAVSLAKKLPWWMWI
ncbi:MAG: hypothetical protein KAS66_04570 [Candidatus Omnitrophica bacterium]|nr:hypothetical protein [Candidatus Omnitrophota bacterium]